MDEDANYNEEEAAEPMVGENEGEQPTESRSPAPQQEQQQPQVMAFATRGELGRYASELQLMRTQLADLTPTTSLGDSYAGGKVVSTYSGQLTQGSVVVLLQDDPSSERYAQCVISGDVTRLLPRSAELGSGELYVHGEGVRLGPAALESECSQEMEVEIVVDGEEGHIWIVSREARNPSFLPSRHPSEFQGRRGNAKKARRRQHMEVGLEGGRLLPNPSDPQPPTSEVPPAAQPTGFSVPQDPRTPTPEASTPQSHMATHYATAPTPPPSHLDTENPVTLPNSLTHTSQQDTLDGAEEGGEEGEDISSSEDILSSTDGESLGSESEREGEKQERTLFPCYQTRARQNQSYSYTKLSELEPGLQKVNVFGVVTDFQPPFQTKGRDFCSIVNITDESLANGQAFKCTFFHSNQERLPKVKKVGDVVCFHRINIKLYPNGVQGIGMSFTSSLSFSGQLGSKVKPATGCVSYTFTPQDRRRVEQLRLWYARQSQRVNPYLRTLRNTTTDVTSSDLVCQVLSVSRRDPTPDSHSAVLRVWDGTWTRHRGLALDLSAYDTTHVADSELCRVSECFSESVIVYGQELVESLVALVPGQIVCLQNLQVKLHTNQYNSFKDSFSAVELRLQPSVSISSSSSRETKIRLLIPGEIEVFELKNRLRKCRKGPDVQFRPLPPDIVPSGLTETPHCEGQQPVPLGSLTKIRDTPSKFLCIVKVLGIEPCSVEGMVQLRCPICKNKTAVRANSNTALCTICPKEKRKRKRKAPTLQPVYFFKLELADETGHVKVYASGAQAARFLSGSPPVIYHRHPQQRLALLEQLYALTGGNDPFDSYSVVFPRPWVAVCLVSMTSGTGTSSSSNAAQDVTYHLFDTTLKQNI